MTVGGLSGPGRLCNGRWPRPSARRSLRSGQALLAQRRCVDLELAQAGVLAVGPVRLAALAIVASAGGALQAVARHAGGRRGPSPSW